MYSSERENATVASSRLFSFISQVFLIYFFFISLKISHFSIISQLFPTYFSIISHFSIISYLFLKGFSTISHFSMMLLISQLHFPTISQLLLNYFPVKVQIFMLICAWTSRRLLHNYFVCAEAERCNNGSYRLPHSLFFCGRRITYPAILKFLKRATCIKTLEHSWKLNTGLCCHKINYVDG